MKIIGWGIGIFLTFLVSVTSEAAAPQWQIVPSKSTLSFTATQNNAPVTGEFKTFTGEISFDPTQLTTSKVRIVVDMTSVSASYSDLTSTLITADWFNVKSFPEAVFIANKFTKLSDNNYRANGNLTIRDKTVPVTLQFKLAEYSDTKTHVIGTTQLKRLDFGVGQGEWKSTSEIKDEVQVNFDINTTRK